MIRAALGTLLPAASPPLDPSGDEARRQLRRELLRPEYNTDDPLQRLLDAIGRLFDGAQDAARGAPALAWAAAVLVVLLLITAAIALASRARRTASERAQAGSDVLGTRLTAAELRARAEKALAAGEAAAALLDAYRATAVRQVERGRLQELPQATAREVARSLADALRERGADGPDGAGLELRLAQAADLFDAVLYGDRPARVEQARDVLDLDGDLDLALARPARPRVEVER
ncbi:hypothetical protein [Nocardioides sp.]|uniref:hypothetical protein n=1 Tax=Nocardioides sp. TaxID=35761 RepID=UPI003513C4D7